MIKEIYLVVSRSTRSLVSVLLLLMPFLAAAQVTAEDIVVDKRVKDDLYVARLTISINAPVYGDFIAVGSTININDSVTQDVLAVGKNIFVKGPVLDDVRCAAEVINIDNNVDGDLIVAGSSVIINKDVVIAGNLFVSGGAVVVNGIVKGEIKSVSGSFILNGIASNNIDARGGKIVINGGVYGNAILAGSGLEIGADAKFSKAVRYWSQGEPVNFRNSISGNSAVFDSSLEIESGKWQYLGFATLLMVVWYLGTALMFIILLQYFFRKTFVQASETIRNSSLKSIGFGLLFLLGVPVAIVIAFITLIGIPLGLLALIAYVTIVLLGTVIVSISLANWINNNYSRSWSGGKIIIVTFGIFIFIKLTSLTPFVGPTLLFLMMCMAFGGILQNIHWKGDSNTYLPK